MKAVNKDKALMALKIKLREAQEQQNADMAAATGDVLLLRMRPSRQGRDEAGRGRGLQRV